MNADLIKNLERETFGDRIRREREALGYSLSQVAKRAGLTKAHFWDMETGRAKNPTVYTLKVISRAIGVPVAELAALAAEGL